MNRHSLLWLIAISIARNGWLPSSPPAPYASAVWHGGRGQKFVFVGNPSAVRKAWLRFLAKRYV